MVSSVCNGALNLFRGITTNPALASVDLEREQFMKNVNHPSPSVSTIDDWLPKGSHDKLLEFPCNHAHGCVPRSLIPDLTNCVPPYITKHKDGNKMTLDSLDTFVR